MGHGSNPTSKAARNNNKDANRARYRSGQDAGLGGPPVDWGDISPETLARVVRDVVAAGDAITFSRTRDGGAYSVTVLADGFRHYYREHHAADIERQLTEIALDAAQFAKYAGD